MLIKVEPAGFFMYTVQFCFDKEIPDSEDVEVQDYLVQHELEPRYQWDEEVDGRQCQWMQFGGCYLGNHLQQIGQLQRKAVEVELLTEEIGKFLDSRSLEDFRRDLILGTMLEELHRETSFGTNDNGELSVFLSREEFAEALERAMGIEPT